MDVVVEQEGRCEEEEDEQNKKMAIEVQEMQMEV